MCGGRSRWPEASTPGFNIGDVMIAGRNYKAFRHNGGSNVKDG
jgi:hypothetical protein